MAARDRYEINVKCPACGFGGEAKVSEGDHPWLRSPEFNVDTLPTGLVVAERSNYRNKTKIKCKCGEVFCL